MVLIGATLVAASAGLNWAQNEMSIQFHGFDDTRGVTVLSPTVDLTKDFSDRTGVRLKFGVDAITAASDGCARCHPSGANNSRVAFGASVVRKYGDTKFTYGGEYGQEKFYRSTTGLASISRDLNKGNTTVAGGFAFSLNQPQLHPTDTTENQVATNAFVSATQTVTRTTIVQGGYEFANINGYQTDPFLRVPVNGVMVVGNTPDLRTRHTFSVRVRQALPADTYLEADYRRYHDTWAIDSNAISLGLSHHFSPQLLLGFAYRWYDQTGCVLLPADLYGLAAILHIRFPARAVRFRTVLGPYHDHTERRNLRIAEGHRTRGGVRALSIVERLRGCDLYDEHQDSLLMRLPVTCTAVLAIAASTMIQAASDVAGSTRQFRYMMGTSVLVEAHGGDVTSRAAAIEEAFASIAEIDRLMSNYRADSELTRLNREGASRDVPLSEPLYKVLEAAQQMSRDSNGAFDVTVGPLVRLWGFYDKKPHIPSAAELSSVRPLVNFKNLLLNPDRRTAHFAHDGVEVDLGGIAKGFAVEVAGRVLARHGLAGLIDAGGNQFVVGLPVGKTAWTFGIKNPDDPSTLLGVVEVQGGSVATSADYANFLVANGTKYGHLLDPRSLQPAGASLSVTILSNDGTLADAATKAAFVLGPVQGLAFIDANPALAGLIAYRGPSGSIKIALSQRLGERFRRVSRPTESR